MLARPGRPARRALGFALAAALLAAGAAGARADAAPGAREALHRARDLFRGFRADAALPLVDSLLRAGATAHDPELDRTARLLFGASLSSLGRAREAVPVLEQVVRTSEARSDSVYLAQALRHLGYSLGTLGRGAESEAAYRRLLQLSLARADSVNEGFARLGLAYGDLLAGRLERSAEGYDRAIVLFRLTRQPTFERYAAVGRCRCDDGLGRLAEARECYRRLIAACRAEGDRVNLGDALNNLGAIEHTTGDLAAAARDYEAAIEIRRTVGDIVGTLVPSTNLALVHLGLGRPRAAEAVLVEAEARAREAGDRLGLVRVAERRAAVRAAEGRPAEAAEILRGALALADSLAPAQRASVIEEYGRTLGQLDSLEAGLRVLGAGVRMLPSDVLPYEQASLRLERANLLARAGRHAESLAEARASRALAERARSLDLSFRARAREGEALLRLGRLDDARRTLEAAAEVWESNRVRQSDPEWREYLSASARLGASALLETYLATPLEPRARAERVFDSLQRFKSRTLRERLRGPWTLGARPPASVRLADVQRSALRDGEVLIETFVGPTLALVIAVTRDSCRIASLGLEPQDLAARLERFRSLAARAPTGTGIEGDRAFFHDASARLGAMLLGPFADLIAGARRIVIAPDEDLARIPWGALADPAAAGGGFAPLLVGREVTLVPSAGVLADLRRAALPAAGRNGVIAIGEAAGPGGTRLPGAAREVRALGRDYRDVTVRFAGGARSFDPARELSGFRALHLAAHAQLDDEYPWRSGIRLGASDDSGRGWLRAEQIAELRLPARLAVLSSCESAGGRVASGEGVLGLTSAFFAAGVPATVATLWPVSDRATERLMKSFYRELSRGASVAEALRTAQLRAGSDPATAAPAFWAGFAVFGDGDVRVPLARRTAGGPWLLGIGLLAIALAGFTLLRRPRTGVTPPGPVSPR